MKNLNLSLWPDFIKTKQLSIVADFKINQSTKIFAMGSCFANEIYKALTKRGFDCYPKYSAISLNKDQIFNKLDPNKNLVEHYDTFTMKHEIQLAMNLISPDDRIQGFYEVVSQPANKYLASDTVWQDPHRKICYAQNKDSLIDLSQKITKCVSDAIDSADIYIITLGLIECWINTLNELSFCRPPNTGYGGGEGFARFHLSSFEENYSNLKEIVKILSAKYPKKQIVISVSPVPLYFTYRNLDVYTANLESKSVLRAVAGRVCEEFDNAYYFPSYEMAHLNNPSDVYQSDGRHVTEGFAQFVMDSFIARFVE